MFLPSSADDTSGPGPRRVSLQRLAGAGGVCLAFAWREVALISAEGEDAGLLWAAVLPGTRRFGPFLI